MAAKNRCLCMNISERIEIEFKWSLADKIIRKVFMLKDDVILFEGEHEGDEIICSIGSRYDPSFVVYPVEDYETLKERLK